MGTGAHLLCGEPDLVAAIGNQHDLFVSLEGLAGVFTEEGRWEGAAQLFGQATVLREALSAPGSAYERQVADRDLEELRGALGEDAILAAMTAGRALSLEQMLEELQRAQAPD